MDKNAWVPSYAGAAVSALLSARPHSVCTGVSGGVGSALAVGGFGRGWGRGPEGWARAGATMHALSTRALTNGRIARHTDGIPCMIARRWRRAGPSSHDRAADARPAAIQPMRVSTDPASAATLATRRQPVDRPTVRHKSGTGPDSTPPARISAPLDARPKRAPGR